MTIKSTTILPADSFKIGKKYFKYLSPPSSSLLGENEEWVLGIVPLNTYYIALNFDSPEHKGSELRSDRNPPYNGDMNGMRWYKAKS
ncbi:MAG: hypothetical protein WC119_00360 [Synergistaceae bacterium]